jgi:acyl-CoA dehydrogenase
MSATTAMPAIELTQDQQDVRDAVRRLAGRFGDEYWAERDSRHEFPQEFYDAFAEGGWLGINIPEEYGGSGLGITEASLLVEEIAASGAAMNGCSAMHLSFFVFSIISKFATEAMRRELLPRAADGKLHVAFGLTEPDAGTDTTRISTKARRDGDGYVISGRKVWCTKAEQSELIALATRTTPREEAAKPTDGMTLFFVPAHDPAVELRAIPKMGRNAVASYEVFIDELRVPESARIGEEGEGFRYLLHGLNAERILIAHEALGIGRAALRRAVDYASERVVFKRPIGSNQGLSFPLAEAQAHLDAAGLMARRAAWLYDRGEPCGREANMAKFLCADAGFKAADAAMQTHGGMGYAREFHVERYFREARLMRLAPVSQEMALNYIAHHVMGLPRSY